MRGTKSGARTLRTPKHFAQNPAVIRVNSGYSRAENSLQNAMNLTYSNADITQRILIAKAFSRDR
jgi:hypothetical protein